MDCGTVVTLATDRLRLELSPSIGGAISTFQWVDEGKAQPILRNCHTPVQKVLDAASFPLVPYVNRIRNGRFTFRGREVRLAPNMPGDPSPLHGQGWLNPWAIDHAEDRRARIAYRHEPDEWPWAYDALQEFALDERGLQVTLACRNLADEPMPCGLGQHPYFPCGPETRIDTHVTHAWTVDQDVLPIEKVLAEGRYDLRDRAVCAQGLDNGFGGWGAEARISDPAWPFALTLSAPPGEAEFFQLYSPPSGGIFVAEPVTHANAALNAREEAWANLGIRVLEPSEEMSLTMRIEVIAK